MALCFLEKGKSCSCPQVPVSAVLGTVFLVANDLTVLSLSPCNDRGRRHLNSLAPWASPNQCAHAGRIPFLVRKTQQTGFCTVPQAAAAYPGSLPLTGFPGPKPELISQLEQEEELWVLDLLGADEPEVLRSCQTGEHKLDALLGVQPRLRWLEVKAGKVMVCSPALCEGKQLLEAFAYKVFLCLTRSICFALKNETTKQKPISWFLVIMRFVLLHLH